MSGRGEHSPSGCHPLKSANSPIPSITSIVMDKVEGRLKMMSTTHKKKLASAEQVIDGLSDAEDSIKTLCWRYIRNECGQDDPSSEDIIRLEVEFANFLSIQNATWRLAYYINLLYNVYLSSKSTTLLNNPHDYNR